MGAQKPENKSQSKTPNKTKSTERVLQNGVPTASMSAFASLSVVDTPKSASFTTPAVFSRMLSPCVLRVRVREKDGGRDVCVCVCYFDVTVNHTLTVKILQPTKHLHDKEHFSDSMTAGSKQNQSAKQNVASQQRLQLQRNKQNMHGQLRWDDNWKACSEQTTAPEREQLKVQLPKPNAQIARQRAKLANRNCSRRNQPQLTAPTKPERTKLHGST